MLCSSLTFGIRQSRCPACPHSPLPMVVQSALLVHAVVSSPSHVLFNVARKTVKSGPSSAVPPLLHAYVLSTLCTLPATLFFTSHISNVLLSVAVPSPLSVYFNVGPWPAPSPGKAQKQPLSSTWHVAVQTSVPPVKPNVSQLWPRKSLPSQPSPGSAMPLGHIEVGFLASAVLASPSTPTFP